MEDDGIRNNKGISLKEDKIADFWDAFKTFDTDEDGGGKIEDDDIIQGTLGDCYFLSAIAALANQEVYVRRLFYTQKRSDTGAYAVYYLINGEWKMGIIDDYFTSYHYLFVCTEIIRWKYQQLRY